MSIVDKFWKKIIKNIAPDEEPEFGNLGNGNGHDSSNIRSPKNARGMLREGTQGMIYTETGKSLKAPSWTPKNIGPFDVKPIL